MKKFTALFTAFVLLFFLMPINNGMASTLDKLPSSQSSKQWSVVIGKPDAEKPEFNKSKPDVFNVYSMDIKSISKNDIKLLRVEAYRNERHSKTEFELFTIEENMDLKPSFHHHNFPLAANAEMLTVIITWSKNGDNKHNRKYREQFVFIQK
jgi:hypothetical protein